MNLHTKNLKSERKIHYLYHVFLFYCIHNPMCMLENKFIFNLYSTWDIYLWSMYYNNSSAVHRRSKHRWENCLFWQSIEHHHYRKPQCQFYEFHCHLKKKNILGNTRLFFHFFFRIKPTKKCWLFPKVITFYILHPKQCDVWLCETLTGLVQSILALCSELGGGADGNSGSLVHSPTFHLVKNLLKFFPILEVQEYTEKYFRRFLLKYQFCDK